MPLGYSEVPPCAPLAPFVKCYWTLQGRPDGPPLLERILPDGAFELVFHFGDPFVANGEPQPRALLVGQIRRPTLLTPSARIDVLGVRFRAGGASAFFREPVSEFRDRILPAEEVVHDWERVMQSLVPSERIGAIERLLLRRMRVPGRWNLASAVIALITLRRGNLRIRHLPGVTGRTERSIERAFGDCVGMTAKTFSRLMRFHAYLAGPLQDHGYFDDAHLVHDFQAFAGTAPSQYRLEQNAINDAFIRGEGEDVSEIYNTNSERGPIIEA